MEKNLPILFQEVIFGSSDVGISKQISKLEKRGEIRKIAPRLYTSNLEDSPELIVRRNLFSILAKLYPNAILSHRSAIEFKPTATGQIFLTYKYTRKAKLPGIIIHFLKGSKAIEGDRPLAGNLYVSQKERALLENLQSSRKTGSTSKTLAFPKIEEELEKIIRINGETALNQFRDKARSIAEQLEMEKEFTKLDKLISALLTTHPSKILKSPLAAARAFGVPYDPNRLEILEILFRALEQQAFKYRPEPNTKHQAFRNFAFFESYFSNYIEGTRFSVDDAKQIIASQKPIPSRMHDSHDVLGTYQIVSNRKEMTRVPASPEELIELLKYRHQILLSARIEKKPGEFKERNNYAGQTAFVDFNLVRGTLIKSFDFYQALQHPFGKAAYMMFAISEIHPFLDGNGRIARLMMNAELVNAKQSKIIIPTVFRDDYLGALRKLTRQGEPNAYIRMLLRANDFSETIHGSDLDEMENKLRNSNAFLEHNEGNLKIINSLEK